MRTGRNIAKVIDLLEALIRNKRFLSARDIAFAANMSHESTLAWLYALHEAQMVECKNTNPREWRWKQ